MKKIKKDKESLRGVNCPENSNSMKDPNFYFHYKVKIAVLICIFIINAVLLFAIPLKIFMISFKEGKLFYVLLICFILISIILALYSSIKVSMEWLDFDYSYVEKKPFEFISSDGIRHNAFVYIKKGLNLDLMEDKPQTKLPAIIGFHGTYASHRKMDRFCVPIVNELGYLYFIYDARGEGNTPGNKNDPRTIDDAAEFIEHVKKFPLVDQKRIAVIGTSMGAVKAAIHGYPNPDVKVVILLWGPYDLKLSLQKLNKLNRLLFKLLGYDFNRNEDLLEKYSAINYFKKEGVVLKGDSQPTSNSERVFLIAKKDDKFVTYENTLKAVEILNLDEKNYRIFQKGGHSHHRNAWAICAAIFNFIKEKL
ncbi:MAG: alpha/beta hydrolase family protein [Promethearchaeota archaeon]